MSTSIQLTQDIEQRLDILVAQAGQNKTYWLHEIIAQGLEDVEDYYLASKVLQRINSGQERVHSSAEIRGDLGLDD